MPAEPEPERLADAVTSLAAGAAEPALRAQLHALSGLVRNIGHRPVPDAGRAALEAALDGALAAEDEAAVIVAMRRLAAPERASIRPVDWSAASGG